MGIGTERSEKFGVRFGGTGQKEAARGKTVTFLRLTAAVSFV
jgi:hypothetical protein